MSKKTAILLSSSLALLSTVIIRYNPHEWSFIIAGIFVAVISLVIAISKIVLREYSGKKLYYYIIIAIGLGLLAIGLM